MNETIENLFTPEQAADELPAINGRRPHAVTVRRWCREGRIKSGKLGGRLAIPRSEIQRISAELEAIAK